MADQDPELESIRVRLAAWLAGRMSDASGLTVSPLRRPGAGVSSETYFVDVQGQQCGESFARSLVIRWPPKGFRVFPDHAYDMGKQYRLLQALAGTSVPVPPVLGMEPDAAVLGAPFFVMEKVDGWVPGDFPPYHVAGPLFEASEADRERIWWDAVDSIAKIHTVDWRKAGLHFLGEPGPGKRFMQGQITHYDEVFALNGEPMPPILSTTREWLLQNSFEPKHIGLCWGDARLGNMLMRDHCVAAVLDWEMACLGDPESDLGWFSHIDWATSVGRAKGAFPRMTGLPSMAETMAYYERVTGRTVENLHYYEVFATWRMAILFTRIEQDASYIARSGNAKGFITWTHFEKLQRLLGL